MTGLSALCGLQSGQVILGYFLFLQTTGTTTEVVGLALMGISMGVKDALYRPPKKREVRTIVGRERNCSLLRKIGRVVWDYKWTAGLIVTIWTNAHFHYLRCYDYGRANCPIGFEVADNYVNIDGDGLNIMVGTGLVTYYVRRILKRIGEKKGGRVQWWCNLPVDFLNRYQFDMMTVIPFVISISGRRVDDFHAYTSLNPPIVLGLIGGTFGTYKEQVDDDVEDPFKPSMSHVAALLVAVRK